MVAHVADRFCCSAAPAIASVAPSSTSAAAGWPAPVSAWRNCRLQGGCGSGDTAASMRAASACCSREVRRAASAYQDEHGGDTAAEPRQRRRPERSDADAPAPVPRRPSGSVAIMRSRNDDRGDREHVRHRRRPLPRVTGASNAGFAQVRGCSPAGRSGLHRRGRSAGQQSSLALRAWRRIRQVGVVRQSAELTAESPRIHGVADTRCAPGPRTASDPPVALTASRQAQGLHLGNASGAGPPSALFSAGDSARSCSRTGTAHDRDSQRAAQ